MPDPTTRALESIPPSVASFARPRPTTYGHGMGFLDKLLGRTKPVAEDAGDKAGSMADTATDTAEKAWDKGADAAGDAADTAKNAASEVADAASDAAGTDSSAA
jgi:hypothetical protein